MTATLPEAVLAHGVGGRQDLPLPFGYVLAGAALALLASFAVLGLAWREPRLASEAGEGRPLPASVQRAVDSRWWTVGLQCLGLVAAAWFSIGLLAGPDVPQNPSAGTVYVLFWVGLVVLASLLLGPVWRHLNPLRTLYEAGARLAGRDPRSGLLPLPPELGYWPAVTGLLAFVWLELVAPGRTTLPVLRAWLAAYVVLVLAGAVVWGSRFFDRGDAFEALSDAVGRLSVLGRRPDGVLVLRNPLVGMAGLPVAAGLTAFVAVLLGSTFYDSLHGAPFWFRAVQRTGWPATASGTLGLAGTVGLVLLAYLGATGLAGRLGGGVREVPAQLAHSVVPIGAGYLVAHYYSLLVLEGQRTLTFLADPLVDGSNWLGTAGWPVSTALVTPSSVAVLQVTAIVAGHVVGAVLAHDRALELFPRDRAVLAQVPLMALMVLYTVTGLLLLLA